MFDERLALWGGFTVFILALLALDLGVFQRRPHVIGIKEALVWFAVWAGLALLFDLGIILFHARGFEAGVEFIAGFLVEKSLSIDNVFVFILIFSYFQVPPAYQHKVLFWGVVGAIVMRVIFIVGGLALMARFHWIIYVFGTLLLATGIRMMRRRKAEYEPNKNWVIRNFRRFFPVAERYDGNRFFTREDGRLLATPLLVVVVAIESSDIVFAVDSIPAIFAITSDPFIVYTSNIFAMLGLRALYFAVANFMQMFHFLHYGFASIILILGVKMLLSDVYHVPVEASLVLIINILAVCLIVSLLRPRGADLKPMFERTERLRLMPFRRLLLIENIIDLAGLTVRSAMRAIAQVQAIRLDRSWEENLQMIRATRFSRYPLVGREEVKPRGVIHLKNLFLTDTTERRLGQDQLEQLARPCQEMPEKLPLEEAMARFQAGSDPMAIVVDDQGKWTGILTFEDVLEELVGRIGDEFDKEREGQVISLADALRADRVVFELQAESMRDAIRQIIERVPPAELPADPQSVIRALVEREATTPTYVGRGLAIPHARFDGIERPVLVFARSDSGVPLDNSNERAELIFLLLTPSGMARIQPRLLAEIASLTESDYVIGRLRKARTPEQVIVALRAGWQVAVD